MGNKTTLLTRVKNYSPDLLNIVIREYLMGYSLRVKKNCKRIFSFTQWFIIVYRCRGFATIL